MSSRLVIISALKQNFYSFVSKQREKHQFRLLSIFAVRIPKANKVFESRRRVAVNSCAGRIVRIAAFIGLPVVYNAPAPSLPSSLSHKKMTEETSLESVLQNADQLFDENHFQEVVDVLDKFKDQSLPDVQWRKARAMFSVSKATKDKKEKERQINDSYELIKSAVASDPTNFAVHKWMAVIMDAAADLQGIKSRIQQLDNIKFHMDEAARLNPDDPTTWHMMGAYEFALAELSWIQRKLVSTIFASPPTGTFEKALENFEKAESLKEGFYSTNWLMIGKCHLALKQTDKAKSFLEKAANCAVLNEDDKKCKEEAVALLKKL